MDTSTLGGAIVEGRTGRGAGVEARGTTAPSGDSAVEGVHVGGTAALGRLELEYGGSLPSCRIAWELHGAPDLPVVVVIGGISAGRHAASGARDRSAGWWEDFIGGGRVIDPADFRVLSFDFLGGPGWSTGPGRELVGSGDTGVEGEPSRGDDARVASRRRFPAVTPLDQANALSLLLDALRIPCVHAVVGSSYGGMVGVAFAARHPARTERLVAISGTHATHPMATALRALQRRILRLGLSVGVESEAVALSRALAMTTYRSASEFRERFDTRASWEEESGWASFPAEEYVLARGRSFSDRFSAHEFLALSESLDLHRVDPTPIQAATTIVSVEGDPIAPEWQAEELARAIGGNARGFTLSSRFGHDAFLKEPELLAPIIRSALDGGARGATVEIGR